MRKEFLHCLRIQFYPGHYEDERIQDVVEFCVKYGFQNVMLFINAEEYNVGHMTVEEAKPWVKTMKKARAALQEKGISVSLNPWIEIGHLDRNRSLKEGQDFVTQMDYDGNRCEMVACPLCENWKAYYLDFYRYLIRELEPDTVWVEDDFRLHNHGDLRYGGCFCDLHIKKYNEKLGTNYTREEFTDRLFRKTPEKRVKKAWLDVSRECMRSLAQDIGNTVKELGLGTKVGLMSSMHECHAMEGRDWHGIHKGFAAGGAMINRLHLPCYDEYSAKRYYVQFNRTPFHCRALLPKGTIVYPELENGAFSTFTKDARFLQFQLESAIPLCIEGMTYDIFDFVGNGTVRHVGYGDAVQEITPYLNGVTALGLQYESLEGIVLPIDEKTVYKRDAKLNGFQDLYPDESHFNAYLPSVGLSAKASVKKSFQGKVVALGGGNVYNFTEEQLTRLFKDNYVIVDGGAARILIDRGLGNLIGASAYETYWSERDVHSYEEVKSGILINGKPGYRATAFGRAGNYVKLTYADESGARSFVYDYLGNVIGVGAMDGGNYFVIPYVLNGMYLEQYHDLRTTLLKDFLRKCDTELVYTHHAGVYAYLYQQKKRKILIVVNSTEEDFDTTELELQNVSFTKIRAVSRKSGRKLPVRYERKGNSVSIQSKNGHLSTQTFILTEDGDGH